MSPLSIHCSHTLLSSVSNLLYILLSALDILDRLLALRVHGRLLALLILEPVLPKTLSKQVVMILVGISRHELVEGVVTVGVVSPWVGVN
jgi:hypothetical protein